jgi:hypothetical protein
MSKGSTNQTANIVKTRGYHASDDEDEYNDASSIDSALGAVCDAYEESERGDNEDDEEERVPERSNEEKIKESISDFAEAFRKWVPFEAVDASKVKRAFCSVSRGNDDASSNVRRAYDDDDDDDDDLEDGEIDTRYVESFVKQVKNGCDLFLNSMGHGRHMLWRNSDYANGWDNFVTMIKEMFVEDECAIHFYHGSDTNYYKLGFDGNFDTLSVFKMGYFSIGPLVDETRGSSSSFEIPDRSIWTKTLLNQGFSHVGVIPVEHSVAPFDDAFMKASYSSFAKLREFRGDVWIYDESMEPGKHAVPNGAALKTRDSKGPALIYVKDTENARNRVLPGTAFFRITMNFLGQLNDPPEWKRHPADAISDERVAKERINAELSNVGDRLKRVSFALDKPPPPIIAAAVPSTPAPATSPSFESAISVVKFVDEQMRESGVRLETEPPPTAPSIVPRACGTKRLASADADAPVRGSKRARKAVALSTAPIGRKMKDEAIGFMELYLKRAKENGASVVVVPPTLPLTAAHIAYFEGLNEEQSYHCYDGYLKRVLFDIPCAPAFVRLRTWLTRLFDNLGEMRQLGVYAMITDRPQIDPCPLSLVLPADDGDGTGAPTYNECWMSANLGKDSESETKETTDFSFCSNAAYNEVKGLTRALIYYCALTDARNEKLVGGGGGEKRWPRFVSIRPVASFKNKGFIDAMCDIIAMKGCKCFIV